MKKFGLLCISLLFIAVSAKAQSSSIARFEGEDIKGLLVNGAFNVKIVKSSSTMAQVDIVDKMVEKLVFELTEEGYVRIAYGSTMGNVFIAKSNIPTITVTMPVLEKLDLCGNITLLSSGEFTAEDFYFNVTDGVTAEFVNVKCKNATVICNGASDIEGLVINAEDTVTLHTKLAASLQIKGSAATAVVISESTSKIDMLLFEAPMVEAKTSGTSLVKANVSKKATLSKKGMSGFKYMGEGTVEGDKASKL